MCNGFDLIDNRFSNYGLIMNGVARVRWFYDDEEDDDDGTRHIGKEKKYKVATDLKIIRFFFEMFECLETFEMTSQIFNIQTNKDDKRENTFFITHF